jgi:hypothetical protein
MTPTRTMTRSEFAQLKAQRWFDSGWCAAAAADVLNHPGSDTAKVQRSMRGLTDQGITDAAARRSYAKGVRAKLAQYRERGLL